MQQMSELTTSEESQEFIFDVDTKVTGENGEYFATLSQNWNIGKKPNGGYLLSVMGAAFREASNRDTALSISAHYLRSPNPGPVRINVELVKSGRTITNLLGRMYVEDQLCLLAIATYGELAAAVGPTRITSVMPEMPPPHKCIPMPWPTTIRGATESTFTDRIELRQAPESDWLKSKEPSKTAQVQCWMRLTDGRPMDTSALTLIVDAAPPALLGVLETGWVPTIDLTVHIKAIPDGEWILARFRTETLLNGFFEEDGEAWDQSGRLIALSRQQAMVLIPKA